MPRAGSSSQSVESHPDIDLGGGAVLRSIGKLDLDGYAALLRRAAIGISLMVSPHPSYPPLEMATLGMLVLTNRFGAKDLSTWHSNIRTTDDISAEGLATELAAMCLAFEKDPDLGAAGRPLRPEFLSETPAFPFASRLAADLRAGVRDRDRERWHPVRTVGDRYSAVTWAGLSASKGSITARRAAARRSKVCRSSTADRPRSAVSRRSVGRVQVSLDGVSQPGLVAIDRDTTVELVGSDPRRRRTGRRRRRPTRRRCDWR